MEIRGGAAVLRQLDPGVLFQRVLAVNDRGLPTNEKDSLGVVQRPYLVRGQQLSATLSSDELNFLLKTPKAPSPMVGKGATLNKI